MSVPDMEADEIGAHAPGRNALGKADLTGVSVQRYITEEMWPVLGMGQSSNALGGCGAAPADPMYVAPWG